MKVATAQFENRSGDKEFNLARIEQLAGRAGQSGAQVVAFHECSVTGYTFARRLSREQLWDLAEGIPGPSTDALAQIARRHGVSVLAGLFERGADGGKCGILICYDNNVIENVRATALLGADIIFMPHVTMCTPSTRPGAGFVDPALWQTREADPTSLRAEFDGLKGRAWLMKWLPARAYDNGVYVVFSNPIGMDDDQLKNGCSMVIDPFGDVLAECRALGDDVAIATCAHEKIARSGGHRYREARKPELYRDILGAEHRSEQKVAWMPPPAPKKG